MYYNLTHAYFAIIPLTSYIFFRNITPGVRSGVSMSFHDLGKTTLETYLLQVRPLACLEMLPLA